MKIQPKDYIPPKSNSIYVYKCTNNESFTFKRYIEYFNDDKIQVRYELIHQPCHKLKMKLNLMNLLMFINMPMMELNFAIIPISLLIINNL